MTLPLPLHLATTRRADRPTFSSYLSFSDSVYPEPLPEPHYYGRDDNGSIHDIDTL